MTKNDDQELARSVMRKKLQMEARKHRQNLILSPQFTNNSKLNNQG